MSSDAPQPSGSPTETKRRGTLLRGLAITALIAVLLAAAFLGGAMVSAASGLFREVFGTDAQTQVRARPSVVVAVRDLAQLQTTTYRIERVIDVRDKQSKFFGKVEFEDALLLVAAADVTAGIDLGALDEADVRANPDAGTIEITLPAPNLISTVLDNDATYVYSRETDLLASRKEGLEARARQEAETALRDAALDAGILDRARTAAERSVEGLLRSFGYDDVTIRWR